MERFILKCRFLIFLFLYATLPVFPGIVSAEQPLPTTRTLEGLVAKWVDLRREAAGEEQGWQEQKGHLNQEYTLLLKEKELLEEEIVRAEKEKTSQQAERAQLFQDKENFQKALDEVLPALSRAEAILKKWQNFLPPSRFVPLEKTFARLKRADGFSVSRRTQLVLSLWGEIERLQHSVYVDREILETDSGQSREFEVIYLGLAQGYCVSKDGKYAGVGSPTEEGCESLPERGWKWRWHPKIAGKVREGIKFYKHEKVAEFVNLPLKIAGVK